MLARFGDLTRIESGGAAAYRYRNASGRAGYEVLPGRADEPGRPLSPMALDEILRSGVWNDYIFRDAEYFWQASLLEPAGGMDNFFRGFLRQPSRRHGTVGRLVRTGAVVTAIDVGADKVTVAYRRGGRPRTHSADFCISTIPVPVFNTLKTNLPESYRAAARALPVQAAGKVG
jgi:monoamine oxidase